MVAGYKSRVNRIWQLSCPLSDYTGRYTHDPMSDIDVSIEQNVLAVRKGNIHVISTLFTEKDTIRVEMIPIQGEVIKFNLTDAGQVESLTYGGMKFTKKKA